MNKQDKYEKKLITRLREATSTFTLSSDEKEHMRSVVHAYVAMKPKRSLVSVPRHIGRSLWWIFLSPRIAVVALVVALVGSSVGVSFAAESALPGDVLYIVKVGVNEQVELAIAATPDARAQTATRLARRRLDEVALLAREGRLTAETRDELQRNFETHVAQVIPEPVSNGVASDDVATSTLASLDRTLSEYETQLALLNAQDHDSNLAPVVQSIRQRRAAFAERRHNASKNRQNLAVTSVVVTSTSIQIADHEDRVVSEESPSPAPQTEFVQRDERTTRVRDSNNDSSNRKSGRTPTTGEVVHRDDAQRQDPLSEPVLATVSNTATTSTMGTSSASFVQTAVAASERARTFIHDTVEKYTERLSRHTTKQRSDSQQGATSTVPQISTASSTSENHTLSEEDRVQVQRGSRGSGRENKHTDKIHTP